MEPTDLIIFDCDGVLIDSEIVVCRVVSEELARLGYHASVDEVIRHFAGPPEREMIVEIESEWGHVVPPDYFERVARRTIEPYGSELRAMPGVVDTLARIKIPVCVASSSYPQKLTLGLECAGLYQRFAPHVVSASYVCHGKPAPDVFIFAAGWMRTPIPRCVVVEDSVPGVRAARAAGIRVLGFAGGSHCPPGHGDRLSEAGAQRIFHDFRELNACLPAAFRLA